MAQSLLKVLEEETKYEWIDDDILEPSKIKGDLTNGTITSVFITLNGVYKRRLPIQTLDQAQTSPPVRPPPPETLALPSNAPLNAPLTTPMTSYARIVGKVAKMYINGMKYDSHNSNFISKRTVFEDVCRRADLPPEQYMRAFPIMLKGLAQDFYYNN
jgi:hypothetical protein